MNTPYKPYWKKSAILAAITMAAIISYCAYVMVNYTYRFDERMILGFCIAMLIFVVVWLVSYIQDPKEFHDWLDGKDIEDKSLSSPPKIKESPTNSDEKLHVLAIGKPRKKADKTKWPNPNSCTCGGKVCNCN